MFISFWALLIIAWVLGSIVDSESDESGSSNDET